IQESPTVIDTVLERLNTDGNLDPTFGTGGVVIQDLGLHKDFLSGISLSDISVPITVAVRPDGTILVGGLVPRVEGVVGGDDGFVARFLSNGSLDTSFGHGGGGVLLDTELENPAAVAPSAVTFSAPARATVTTAVGYITLQADGKILVTTGIDRNLLIRLNQDGTVDTGFASDPVDPDRTLGFFLPPGLTY